MAKKKLTPEEVELRIRGLENYFGIVFDGRDEDYPDYLAEDYGLSKRTEDRIKDLEKKPTKKHLWG